MVDNEHSKYLQATSCLLRHIYAKKVRGHLIEGVSLCRDLKQQSLAEWKAAKEQEELEAAGQLAEQQELQRQVSKEAASLLLFWCSQHVS